MQRHQIEAMFRPATEVEDDGADRDSDQLQRL
jgi:hypothetical protein